MKKLLFVLCLCVLPCWGQNNYWGSARDIGTVAHKATSTLYVMTKSSSDLRTISLRSRKNVKLYIIVSIGAAKESSQLKSLLARGAEIWVMTELGPKGTTIVADTEFVADFKEGVFKDGSSVARDYIKKWKNMRASQWAIPCLDLGNNP
jgi:hypothetical protein